MSKTSKALPPAPQSPEVVDGTLEPPTPPAAEYVPIDSLKPWEDNPRKNDDAVGTVAKSMRRFGFGAPILARRENGEIIAGHTRWRAAKKLRLTTVPVRFLDLSTEEAHALALADNKTNEIADWDKDLLAAVVGDLNAHGIDLETGTGFDEDEIDKLLSNGDVPPDGGGESSLGDGLKYSVVVDCEDERQQAMLLERLDGEGFKCKPLIA